MEGQELYDAMKHNFNHGDRTAWVPTTKDQYWEALEVLPPVMMGSGSFLRGECWVHEIKDGKITKIFAAFREKGKTYAARYMSVAEFKNEFPNAGMWAGED